MRSSRIERMKNHSYKNTFCLWLLSTTLIACQPSADISGILSGSVDGGTIIYAIHPQTLRQVSAPYFGKIIDSAQVNADGSFAFNHLPKQEAPLLLELAQKVNGKAPNYLHTDDPANANFMPVIWQPGLPLHITAEAGQFQRSFAVANPSAAQQALLELRDVHQAAYRNYLEGKSWQVEDGSGLMKQAHALRQYQSALIHFAEQTSFLLPALVAVRWVSPEHYYERLPEFLVGQCQQWHLEAPDHPWVIQLCELGDPAHLPVLIGDTFPDVQLPLASQDTVTISDIWGDKLTIVDLWASWCAPCRKENRQVLVPLWDQYHDQGLQIIAYGLESDASQWHKAIIRDGADRWIHASDLQGDEGLLMQRIRLQTIPANFVLNGQGVVIAKNLHGKDLMDWVASYMAE